LPVPTRLLRFSGRQKACEAGFHNIKPLAKPG